MRLMPGSRSNIEVRVPSLSHEVEVDIIKDNPGGSGITIFLHVLVNTCGRAYTLEMLQKTDPTIQKKLSAQFTLRWKKVFLLAVLSNGIISNQLESLNSSTV